MVFLRSLGNTGIELPPIVFRASVLANPVELPDQTKRIICAEWISQAGAPLAISIRENEAKQGALRFLLETLRRHEVRPADVILNLEMRWLADTKNMSISRRVLHQFADQREETSEHYAASLITVQGDPSGIVELSSQLFQHANGDNFELLNPLNETLGVRLSKNTCVGLAVDDVREAAKLTAANAVQYLAVRRGLSILDFVADAEFKQKLTAVQRPMIAGGVLAGGFLVGDAKIHGRVVDPIREEDQRLLTWRKAFTSLCHGHGVRPVQACVQFALSLPGVVAVSLDTSRPERVAENVFAATTRVPAALWESMQEEGLIGELPW